MTAELLSNACLSKLAHLVVKQVLRNIRGKGKIVSAGY
jgi:hypothetical protein